MEEKENTPAQNEQIVEVAETQPSIFEDAVALNSFIHQVPGLLEICDFANLPDEQFKEIQTYVTVGIESAYAEPSFKQELKRLTDALSSEDFRMMTTTFAVIDEELSKLDCIDEKKVFLRLIMDSMSTGITDMYNNPYDIEVPIQFFGDADQAPLYAHSTDAGADVFAAEDFIIPANSFGYSIPLGFALALPRGWQVEVRPRSGLSKKTHMRISNTPGTIDAGYRDELALLTDNFGEDLSFKRGDRVCQLVLQPIYRMKFIPTDNVKNVGEDRGGGFGSTGS